MAEPTKKPAPGGHREAGTIQNNRKHSPYPVSRSLVKHLIVATGARGSIPLRLADAMIQLGGLRHD